MYRDTIADQIMKAEVARPPAIGLSKPSTVSTILIGVVMADER